MAELNQKYRNTAFLALAITIFSIFLIRDYDNSLTSEEKNIYTFMFFYLTINMVLCILFLYYYSILDNLIVSNRMNEVKPVLTKLEIFYGIINISSIPFIFVIIFKIINKYRDTLESLPPKFNLNTQRYY